MPAAARGACLRPATGPSGAVPAASCCSLCSAAQRGARLSDIRFEQPLVYDLNTRLDEILRKMADGHVHTVLVTRHGKLAGIFTVTDACRHFAGFLRDEFGQPGGDEAA